MERDFGKTSSAFFAGKMHVPSTGWSTVYDSRYIVVGKQNTSLSPAEDRTRSHSIAQSRRNSHLFQDLKGSEDVGRGGKYGQDKKPQPAVRDDLEGTKCGNNGLLLSANE